MSKETKPNHNEELLDAPPVRQKAEANVAQSDPADDGPVGPGRPPRHTRWKKNGPSPNPRGRPRKEQSMAPDVRKAFTAALNKKVRVTRGEKEVLMTRVEAGIEQLLNQFARGDRHARHDLMAYAEKLGIDFLAKERQAIEDALAPNLQAILDAYVARVSNSGNVAPITPALASPELLNDDGADETCSGPTGQQTQPEPMLVAPATANNGAGPAPRSPAVPTPSPQPGTIGAAQSPPPSPLSAAAGARPPISAASPSRSVTRLMAHSPKPQPARRPAPALQTAPTSPPPPDPEPEPGKIYPKPFSRMRWTERRAWYPDWFAKYEKWKQGIQL